MGIGHNHAAWVNELVVMAIEKFKLAILQE